MNTNKKTIGKIVYLKMNPFRYQFDSDLIFELNRTQIYGQKLYFFDVLTKIKCFEVSLQIFNFFT